MKLVNAILMFVLMSNSFAQMNEYDNTDFDEEVRRMNRFGFNIYNELNQTDDNLILSPFSLSVVFSMLENGTDGVTSNEVQSVVNLNEDRDERNEHYRAMFNYLKEDTIENGVFNWVVKVFLDDEIKRSDGDYSQTLQEYYYSELEDLDFAIERKVNNRVQSWMNESLYQEMQNNWEETNRYKDVKMDLAAVTYLEGDWLYAFDGVKVDSFATPTGDTITKDFIYAESYPVVVKVNPEFPGDTIFEIPFKGSLSFEWMKLGDSTEVDESFSYDDYFGFKAIEKAFWYKLQLPVFQLDKITRLKKPLTNMGMNTAFSSDAGFGEVAIGLQMRDAWHESYLNFSQKGKNKGFKSEYLSGELILNHSFRFFVRGRRSDILLFVGEYTGIK